ncbi:MAG: type IVB secretion system lipoprotein DotD [Gammaproteobacteria bacterium]
MIKIKLFSILSVGLLLSACVLDPTPTTTTVTGGNDDATAALAHTATSVDRSLMELARIQAVAKPPSEKQLPQIDSNSMPNRISVDWTGPIGPAVDRIAAASQYKVRVLGIPPAIPVLVSITAYDAAPGDVLRDLAYQAGDKADIFVYPENRTIELRYATS